MTKNHGYETPPEGTLDWHVPLNENFSRLDTDVEIRDSESSLEQYTPKAGAKFFATDTGRRYLGDGTQWTVAPTQPLTELNAPNVTSDPAEAVPGELWYRTDTNTLKVQLEGGVQTLADGPDSSSGDTGDTSHTLEIVAASGAVWDTYTATIDGEVTGTDSTDSGDTVTTQSDGTVLVEGGIKDGKSESYSFTGSLIGLTLSVDGTAYLDGAAIDPADY